MKKRIWAVVLVSAGLCACFRAHVPLNNIPLMWKPTSEITLPPGAPTSMTETKVQFEVFKDVRKQPELIAENREDPTPKPVTTPDNVGEFVSKNVRTVFDRAGLKTVDSDGDVIIGGEVRQFFVEETSTYKGHVLLHLSARNRAGKTLWTGSATGENSRFGHSYSAENYYETFSDTIINAITTLLQDPEFQAVLAKKK